MTPRHRVSRAAIELVERFEGYRRKAAQLPDGRWTVGYGHTKTARAGVEISQADAEALLTYDMMAVAEVVETTTYSPLTRNEFDALCAFAFSIGVENFRRSGVLRRINEGAHLQAACAMELWRRATIEGHSIVVDALVRRRAAEKSLFLTPDRDAWVAAPSAIVRPDLDYDNAGNVPRETPATVTTPLEGERTRVEREPGVSPTQTAAASVTARLRNLFRGEEEPRAPAKTPLVLDAEEPFVLTPPDEDQAPIEAWPAAEPRETFATDVVTRDLFDPAEAPAEAEPLELTEALEVAPEDSRPSWPLLLVLAAVGLILFAGSLYWYFNGSGGAKPPGFSTVMVLTASLAGVAAFGASVYLMLERLGRAVGDLGEEVDG